MAGPSISWAGRLEERLTKLADTASKESILALAKYVGFRRKNATEVAVTLANAIADPKGIERASSVCTRSNSNRSARQWLYLQVVHESVMLDSGTSRWERLSEMRETLGESCMIEVAQRSSSCMDAGTKKKIDGLVKQWDNLNAFGGPTLVNVLKKHLTAAAPASKDDETSSKIVDAMAMTDTPGNTEKCAENDSRPPACPKSPNRDRLSCLKGTSIEGEQATPGVKLTCRKHGETRSDGFDVKVMKREVVYDFGSKSIPFGEVDSKNFLSACKAIATLQIARDLRNDAAVQLSSLLKALPEDVKSLCEEADEKVRETGKPYRVKEDMARELSLRTNEMLLDMDLDEQIQNVQTFIEIVEKQREARQRLIYMLVRSRCHFGADDAAEAFYRLDRTAAELRTRKDTLLDAMALEGLDFEEDSQKAESEEPELAPLGWYCPQDTNTSPPAKRAKID